MSNQITRIPDVDAHILFDHGEGAQVDVFDAESIAGLIRHAETYPDSPILPHLRQLFGDLSKVDADQIEAIGGAGYALRVALRPDYDADSPRDWHNLSTLACLESWRDWLDLSSDADDIVTSGPRGIGAGPDLDVDDIKRLGANSWSTSTERLRYRLLHLDGARGIRNVGTLRDGIAHTGTEPDDGRLDHEGVAWVPRGVILEHAPCPEGAELTYTPAAGWQYVNAEGVHTPAEDEVEEWADKVTTSDLDTLNQYMSGEIYGLTFQVSTVDLDDEHTEPDDYDARLWDDAPDGDLWGLFGDEDTDVARAGSTGYWQALEALLADLSAMVRLREAERRTRDAHAALVADLDKFDPGTAELLRALWGPRFRHITSHREIAKGLANDGLQLAVTASGTPALAPLTKE